MVGHYNSTKLTHCAAER